MDVYALWTERKGRCGMLYKDGSESKGRHIWLLGALFNPSDEEWATYSGKFFLYKNPERIISTGVCEACVCDRMPRMGRWSKDCPPYLFFVSTLMDKNDNKNIARNNHYTRFGVTMDNFHKFPISSFHGACET